MPMPARPRILFSAVPAAGHVLPLLPLADAAADLGHDVAFLSAVDTAGLLGSRTLLPAGPGIPALLAETERRTSGGDARHPGDAAVENFAGARVDLTFDQALTRARGFGPDLLVCDTTDFVGPMVAAALDIPWAAHAISAPLPEPLAAAMRRRAAAQHAIRGLSPRDRVALIDPLPEILRATDDPPVPADLLAIRPTAYAGNRWGTTSPSLPEDRPLVLVTAGTSVEKPDLVADLVTSVADAGHHVLVTAEPGALPGHPRVHPIGFVPLARVLPAVAAVVGTAGLGTVLATLAAGLPTVLHPILADQPWNAHRVAATGAGIVIDAPAQAGPATRTALTEPDYRAAASSAAAAIAAMPSPAAVLAELLAAID
ncbi:glycosyltransferase [Nocardia sp. CDC159]|uniref:Glycosyltransferase n=1 Tax=Nocardia pulmonis TaxID=2951408 RepID=A0A9X2E377_9NOCA|nr:MULTISPECIES: glycosyltransferase [Nocardia]MCM6773089.1 glycosyltransferase [Nocardia pulmonis]MCM6785608.1 glycosyltransferase [Nocardia sp. CDC159]